ncbi:MAG TPA: hypothetical protein GX694_03965 [Actinomycetales bacterium]|nr:hypothetical protein [Actinomycetales bacterium]
MGLGLVILRRSAFKHGLTEGEIRTAFDSPLLTGPLDDDHPQRILALGFDTVGRVREIAALRYDDGSIEIIHAMKARKAYLDLLD